MTIEYMTLLVLVYLNHGPQGFMIVYKLTFLPETHSKSRPEMSEPNLYMIIGNLLTYVYNIVNTSFVIWLWVSGSVALI